MTTFDQKPGFRPPVGRNFCPTGNYIKPAGHDFFPGAVFWPTGKILSRGPKMTNTAAERRVKYTQDLNFTFSIHLNALYGIV